MTCKEHGLLDKVSTLRNATSVTSAVRQFLEGGGSATVAYSFGLVRSTELGFADKELPWGLQVALTNLAGEGLTDGRRVDEAFWQSYLGLDLG